MKGKMILYQPGTDDPVTTEYSSPLTLKDLNDAVGGYIEVVPYFNSVFDSDKHKPCVVFCNENGKLEDMHINVLATALWYNCLQRQELPRIKDHLVGPIAVVLGDEEFMNEL